MQMKHMVRHFMQMRSTVQIDLNRLSCVITRMMNRNEQKRFAALPRFRTVGEPERWEIL